MTAADLPLWLVIAACLIAVPILLIQAHRRERAAADRQRMIDAARKQTS